MGNKFFFISYRIDLGRQTPIYGQEMISMSPFEYIVYHKKLGGSYADRIILYAQEISKHDFDLYSEEINEE